MVKYGGGLKDDELHRHDWWALLLTIEMSSRTQRLISFEEFGFI